MSEDIYRLYLMDGHGSLTEAVVISCGDPAEVQEEYGVAHEVVELLQDAGRFPCDRRMVPE